jgi:hypothetical protein
MRRPLARPTFARLALSWALSGALALAVPVLPAAAQEEHDPQHHHHAAPEELGTVHFPISCGEEARAPFTRGLALLHSFGYEEAARAFGEAAAADPECAMAHWGLAMSYFHPIWAPPTEAEHAAGLAASRRAAELGGADEREQAWVAMVAEVFDGGPARPNVERAKAFEQAMAEISARWPDDPEATVFHGLSILSIAYNSPPDKSYALQKRAAAILDRILPEHPDHPGVAHYVIHSFDYPELAELALPAARAYAAIAPDAPHALHMPSHIFTRLGLWEESIRSNLASAAAGQRQLERTQPGATAYETLHAHDYLAYAYLQTAQDAKAREVFEALSRVTALDAPAFSAGYALAAIPARYTLERRDWAGAAALPALPDVFPWARFPYAEASLHFARTVGAARLGDLDRARAAYARLQEIQAGLAAGPQGGFDWATQVEIQRLAAEGWLRHAEGNGDEAERLLRAAADLEGATDKHPVTPGSVLPAREQLADLLLERGKPAEALREYEASLATAPARFRSLAGAAQAAEAAGDTAAAGAWWERLTALATDGGSDRPELVRARAVRVGE